MSKIVDKFIAGYARRQADLLDDAAKAIRDTAAEHANGVAYSYLDGAMRDLGYKAKDVISALAIARSRGYVTVSPTLVIKAVDNA